MSLKVEMASGEPGCEKCRDQDPRPGWDLSGKWSEATTPPPGWVPSDHVPNDRRYDNACKCNPEAVGAIRNPKPKRGRGAP